MKIAEVTIPDAVIEHYSYGNCMWLAMAVHQRFGWPIMAQIHHDAEHGDYIAHAYNLMSDGREFDIFGPQQKVDIFSDDEAVQFTPAQMIQFIEEKTFKGKRRIPRTEIDRQLRAANYVIHQYLRATVQESAVTRAADSYFAGPRVTEAWNEARNPRSRYTIAYMSPQEFMAVAEPGFDPEKWQNVQGYIQRKEPFPSLPFIGFDEHGKVLSHEGRHRMRMMHQLGVQQVPVVLRSSVHRWGDDKNPRPTHLHPQTGAGHSIPMPRSVTFPEPRM